jgi:hypothetical protein
MKKGLLEVTLEKAYEVLPTRIPVEDFLIDNVIKGISYFRKSNYSEVLGDMCFYLAIVGQGEAGFAYFNPSPKTLNQDDLQRIVNKNVFTQAFETNDLPLKTALIDAITGLYNKSQGLRPNKVIKAEGSYQSKAAIRARLLTEGIKPAEKVLLVGAVSEIAREVLARQADLRITDLSKDRENTHLHGIPIELTNGKTMERMDEANTAIITGATFSSGTVDGILEYGRELGTKMIFYLETANNFGPQLIDAGAHLVVAEKFPFYDLPGSTFMEVHEKK